MEFKIKKGPITIPSISLTREGKFKFVIAEGKSPRDVDSAKANGCRSVAVASGWVTAATLRQTEPDVLMDDLSDPEPIWDMLGQT